MAIVIVVIQMMLFSLAMAEQELTTDLDGWWYLVKPVQISPQSSPTSGLSSIEQPAKRDDYTYTSGIGAHKILKESVTWNDARKSCQQDGAHLVIINSVAEAELVHKLLGQKGKDIGWIGVHDEFEEGNFVTIHDEPLTEAGFDTWMTGEPNNAGGEENCVYLGPDAELNDTPCNFLFYGICELPSAQALVV